MYLPRSNLHRILALTLPGGIALGLLLYALLDVVTRWGNGETALTFGVALILGGIIGLVLSLVAWLNLRYALHEARQHAVRTLNADLPPLTDTDPLVALRQTVADAIAAVPRSSTLVTLAKRLCVASDREAMLAAVAETLSEHLPVRGAVLLLHDAECALLFPSAAWGIGVARRSTTFDINSSAVGRALRERRSVHLSSVQMRELLNTASPQTLTVVSWPLWVQQTPIGSLCLILAGTDLRLNEEQQQLVEHSTTLFTAYLQTTIYRQWLEREQNRLAIFERIAGSVAEQPDLERALVQLLRIAAELTESSHGTFLLIDAETLTIRSRITLSGGDILPLNLASAPILKHGLAGWVLRAQRGIIIDDIERDTRWIPTPGLELMRSALSMPLFHGERPIGVLTLASLNPYHYSQRALALVSVLAAYAITVMVRYGYEGIVEPEHLFHARRLLGRYLPPTTVRELMGQQAKLMQALQPQAVSGVFVYACLRGIERLTDLTAQQLFERVAAPFHNVCRSVVHQQRGVYIAIDERSFSAVFGFPQPQSDDAVRALEMARKVQAVLGDVRLQWRQQFGVDLALAGGITTGQVVVGVIGQADNATMAWSGTAMREARRLCQLARNDEIVVAESVLKTIPSGQFVLEPLTPVSLHNKNEPTSVYRLAGHL
ncbi:GAF domain-containing protein [Chloroflexus sp.]|uniref:GAF domain-containing protein n=1 Tax=Chloroflexus sp. TaxID=1904827 RepID=UPI002ADD7CE5|nr:GAF domain-containing protein [Chloroflexus sp.]